MKRIFTLLLFIMAGFVAQGQNIYVLGSGTPEDPFQVATAEQLDSVRKHLDKHFIQTAVDIDLVTYISNNYPTGGWLPIGVNETGQRFRGTYDGKGYTISGLTIDRPETNNVGLFGCIGFGGEGTAVVIRNVHLISVGAITGASGTGALVGRINGDSNVLIEGCSVTGDGTVSGTRVTGGLVGANNSWRETPGGTDNPTIRQCSANIPVEGRGNLLTGGGGADYKEKIGGLVGCNQKGNTIDSYAHGSVTIVNGAAERVGGLAGCTDLRGMIERGYSTGLVTPLGSTDVGGLVGALSGRGGNVGVVNESYWDTETSGQTTSAGGTGKPTADMQTQSTYVGWDFDVIWSISPSNYPTLEAIIGIVGSGVTEWMGATSNNWNDASNWSAGVPAPSATVSIPGSTTYNPLLSGSATMTGLTIAAGASLTIGPMGSLRVSGTLTNHAGNGGLTIKSDATGTGSLISQSAVDASIERYISGSTNLQAMQYHMVSIPLTQAANPTSNLFLGAYLYRFHTPTQAWDPMGSETDKPLFVDQGYMIYYPEASKTYTFSGKLNSGDFVIPVSFDNPEGSYSGFNLVPNPYPSVIDWDATKIIAEDPDPWTKTNLDDAIWIWNPGLDQYAAYVDGAATHGGTAFIPVGQSFFVRANNTSAELTVRNGARVHDDQPFFKKGKGQTDELLRVRALANNYSDEIVVRFLEGATPQHDSRFDAVKMYGSADAPQLYSQAADGQKLSIYSHPHPTENISIPLGFELADGETAKLEFEGAASFDAEMQLLLEDLLEDVVIDLRTESEYSFAHEPGLDPNRFVLHMQVKSVTGTGPLPEEMPFRIFAAGQRIHVHLPELGTAHAEVEVIDLLGRVQQRHQVETGTDAVLDAGAFKGVAIIRVVAGQQVFTRRVIIQ